MQRLFQRRQQRDQCIRQGGLERGGILKVLPVDRFAQSFEQHFGRLHAHVGREQDGLQFLVKRFIYFAACAKQSGDLAAKFFAGFG